MADMKIGAYVCKGCGLGERLDCDELATVAQRDGKAQVVQQHDFLCSSEGVKMIQNDIDNEGVNRVVIAACSRRAKSEAFNFQGVTISRANLREGVIWIRPDEDDLRETTQEMAADYVRMGCAEAKFSTPPASEQEKGSNDTILVVGGGITGMTAAIEAAKTGYPVHLVEKTGELGGAAAKMWKDVPMHSPYTDPVDTQVAAMVADSAIDWTRSESGSSPRINSGHAGVSEPDSACPKEASAASRSSGSGARREASWASS